MRHEYEIVEHPHLEYLNLFLVKLIHRRLHLHREFEICMVLEGEVTVYTTGKTAVLKKEDVILLNPRQVHAFHSMTENALLLSIQVMPGAFEKICQGIRYTEFDTLCLSEPEYQGETLDHLRELFTGWGSLIMRNNLITNFSVWHISMRYSGRSFGSIPGISLQKGRR